MIQDVILQSLVDDTKYFPERGESIHDFGIFQESSTIPDDLNDQFLYCALAVQAADMNDLLRVSFLPGTEGYKEMMDELIRKERSGDMDPFYSEPTFPDVDVRRTLPKGMSAMAICGQPSLVPLARSEIVHEWTTRAGVDTYEHLIEKYKVKLREQICGPLRSQIEAIDRTVSSAMVPMLASAIIAACFTPIAFFYPIAVLIAFILIKAGLATLCD